MNLPLFGTSNLTSVSSPVRNVPAFVRSVGEVRDAVETGSPRLASPCRVIQGSCILRHTLIWRSVLST